MNKSLFKIPPTNTCQVSSEGYISLMSSTEANFFASVKTLDDIIGSFLLITKISNDAVVTCSVRLAWHRLAGQKLL